MASIVDDRGYNQGFIPTRALDTRTERRCKAILDAMEDRLDANILEIGCGTGDLSFRIARNSTAKVLGTDICEPFVVEARSKYKLDNLSYIVTKIDGKCMGELQGTRFDYIVGNGILHHLYNDLDLILPRFKNLLKPGGRLIFWEPNLRNPYVYLIFKYKLFRKLARLEPDEMAFTASFIASKMNTAGLVNVRAECRDFLLPNTPGFAISLVVALGHLLEKSAFTRWLSQSIFITADKPS